MRTRFALLSVWTFALAAVPAAADSNAACPYDSVGDRVLAALSYDGWDSLWASVRAPELGDKILEGVRKNLLPAILADEEVGSGTAEERVEELVDGVDWKSLSTAPMSVVVWSHEELLPQFAWKVETTEETRESVRTALVDLLRIVSGWMPDSRFREEGDRAFVAYRFDEEFSDAVGVVSSDWLHLEPRQGAVWITLMEPLDRVLVGKGLAEREGFREFWERGTPPVTSSMVLDFAAIAGWVSESFVEAEKEWTSSLVLDETAEALFADDLETLEKLRQVHSDMDLLTGTSTENDLDPFLKIFDNVADLGLLVGLGSDVPSGMSGLSLWRPNPDSKIARIADVPPLSPVFLSLVQPDFLKASVFSLPNLLELHDFVIEIVRGFPDSDMRLAMWEEFQRSIDFRLREDLLAALGNELAILTRRTDQASFAGFRLVNSETWVILETGEKEKVLGVLSRLSELLATYQLEPAVTVIEGASFTQVAGGLLGELAWGWVEDPGALVVTTAPKSDFFPELLESIRNPKGAALEDHPRWEILKSIWVEDPIGVVFDDLSTTWKQQVDQLMGARMMLSMMGGEPIALGMIGLAMDFFSGVPTPEVYLRVDASEGEIGVSRSLFLFPEGESESSP